MARSAILALCNEEAAMKKCGATRGSALLLTEAVFSTCASSWLASSPILLFTLFATAAFSLLACRVERNALIISCREKKKKKEIFN